MNFGIKNDEFCIKNDDFNANIKGKALRRRRSFRVFCAKNDGFCVENDGFVLKNDGFALKVGGVGSVSWTRRVTIWSRSQERSVFNGRILISYFEES